MGSGEAATNLLGNRASTARLLPFLVFMGFIALDEGGRFVSQHASLTPSPETYYYLYPVKTVVVLALLFRFRPTYTELRWGDLTKSRQSLASLAIGILTFALWINMDWAAPAVAPPPGFDPNLFGNQSLRLVMEAFRVTGAVLVVPLMEELFWRSFVLRYLIHHDFESVPIGRFTFFSFVATAILFGLEHHFILAGIAAGAIYNIILYRTKSIAQCVLAHAVTNLALAVYVLSTGKWYFW